MSRQYKTQHKSSTTQDLHKVKSRDYLLFSLYIESSHFSREYLLFSLYIDASRFFHYLYKHYIDLSIIVFFLQVLSGSPSPLNPALLAHEKHH